MATLSKHVGYEYEFVDQVPEDYFCKLCKHVAREPTIASCCTEILCKACIDVIVQDKKPCPSCEDVKIKELGPHSKNQTKILALEVHCTMKDRGCEWTGQLQHLDAHLDITTGDCQYVDVECPNKCDQKVQKRNVDTHLVNECPNRDYRCPHCNFTDTYQVVTEQHWEVCSYYPLACPNRCGVTFERGDLEDHMKMCRLEEVQCVFSSEGCQAKFIRDNEDDHMNQNTQKHLAMMPAATLRISQKQQTFEQKLQERECVLQNELEEKAKRLEQVERALRENERTLRDMQDGFEQRRMQDQEKQKRMFSNFRITIIIAVLIVAVIFGLHMRQEQTISKLSDQNIEKHGRLEQNISEKLDTQITALEEQLQTNYQQQQQAIKKICGAVYTPPYDITFSNYQEEKARDDYIVSPPMYTHPGGYKFELSLYPNGWGVGRGTHVSVYVYSLKGDHDAELKFPVKFTITLQLLNQHRDQDHHTRDIQCRVTREWIGSGIFSIGSNWIFILNADLEWNHDKQTQYLKDNCLKFRITKIVVH